MRVFDQLFSACTVRAAFTETHEHKEKGLKKILKKLLCYKLPQL